MIGHRGALVLASLALSVGVVAPANAHPRETHTADAAGPPPTTAAVALEAEDEAVVLPRRVAVAIRRANTSLAVAEQRIAAGRDGRAMIALRAYRQRLVVAVKAARHQMTAAPADPEAESTAGPDSVVAVLGLEQQAAMRLAVLFDGHGGPTVTTLTNVLSETQVRRGRLLSIVFALDPEGAGADYADGMADSLDGYAAEVAAITQALAGQHLSPQGAEALRLALARSQAAEARMTAIFGGGE